MTTDHTPAEIIRYTADVVALTPEGNVLLIERDWDPYEGQHALPGGHVDPGETGRAAAARELAEETGVHVDPARLIELGTFDRPDRDPRGRYVSVAWLAHLPAGTTATAGDDARSAGWWPLSDPPPLLAFDHKDILEAARERQYETAGWAAYLRERVGRCPAAHPSDPSACRGPVAVTVIDANGTGCDGCEHHAARMLASLHGARVAPLPDAPEGAAIRTFRTAGELPPYAWRQPLNR
ncbi:NUDIX hydrolase [Streptomyces armeniacus]|uniref:NUDIX hydrolase n=1 Tax=Streptomyces armeniacus TaxID=83291 RepID=A0A345XSR0_9ACTN|nr:NUDIX hydrolase [Streptomyces armeniacus]